MAAKSNIQRDKQSQAAKKAAEERKAARQARSEPREPKKEAQQEPEQDSGLQTPQPDQPMPTEVERQEQAARKDESDSEARPQESETADDAPEQPRVDEGDQPDQQPDQPGTDNETADQNPDQPTPVQEHVMHGGRSFRADVRVDDHIGLEAKRQDELAQAREKHNQRAGNPDASSGAKEFQAALEEHKRRSAHRFDVLINEESGEEQDEESEFAATGRKAG